MGLVGAGAVQGDVLASAGARLPGSVLLRGVWDGAAWRGAGLRELPARSGGRGGGVSACADAGGDGDAAGVVRGGGGALRLRRGDAAGRGVADGGGDRAAGAAGAGGVEAAAR